MSLEELEFLQTISIEGVIDIIEALSKHPEVISINVVWADDLAKMAKASGYDS